MTTWVTACGIALAVPESEAEAASGETVGGGEREPEVAQVVAPAPDAAGKEEEEADAEEPVEPGGARRCGQLRRQCSYPRSATLPPDPRRDNGGGTRPG